MKLIGKDNGKHVVRNGEEILHLDDSQFAEFCLSHPELAPAEPVTRGLMGGWKHVGMDEGRQVVKSDEGTHYLTDVQFAMLRAGTSLKEVLFPERKKDEPQEADEPKTAKAKAPKD